MANEAPDRDIQLKAFETARAWSALIVTLSTGGIVFTAIFKRDFAPKGGDIESNYLLVAGWIALGVAAALGIFFLGALTSTLNRGSPLELDVYHPVSRTFGGLQILAFLVGLGCVLAFAIVNID